MEGIPQNVNDQLQSSRESIDEIDSQIIDLLNKRAKESLAIAAIKSSLGLPVYSYSRENDVLTRVMQLNEGPHTDVQMVGYYVKIMGNSRQIQADYFQQEMAQANEEATSGE